MSIKTITTILADTAHLEAQLDAAVHCARACDAHLQVIALGLGFDSPGVVGSALEAMPLAVGLEEAEHLALERGAAARRRLEREDIRWDVEQRYCLSGGLAGMVAGSVRFSDLVVQLRGPEQIDNYARRIIEAVLLETPSPLLILPMQAALPRFDGRVMLAWDHRQTALRATRLTLPLLARADIVQIALVDPSREAPDRSDPGGDLARFLSRHGVRAEISVLTRSGGSIAQTLSTRARETGCEMIVMGAYGHARLRQALFGGTTRAMLEEAELPVLLAH
ncbi:universal stress protein [Sulfitobacter aestuarii]|uniref:Universal stress protein n=1 Tax=Sulfitobacter aestuarii TaxID=2161676 RepID=A0ABW5U273_9RHOB